MSFSVRDLAPVTMNPAPAPLVAEPQPLPLLPLVQEAPPAQLPAIATPAVDLRKTFTRLGALEVQMQSASERAISRVGSNSPFAAKVEAAGYWTVAALSGVTGLGGGAIAALSFAADGGTAFMAGLFSAAGAGLGFGIGWSVIAQRFKDAVALRPPSKNDLKALRAVDAVVTTPVEAAALHMAAKAAADSLRYRKVHGFEAQEIIASIAERGANVDSEATEQAVRFSKLRDALASYAKSDSAPIHEMHNAIDGLTDDEKRQLAPLVLEKTFSGEVPTRNIAFRQAYDLHMRLWDIAHDRPDLGNPYSLVKDRQCDWESFEYDESYGKPKATRRPRAKGDAAEPAQTSVLATLDTILADLEAALVPNLDGRRVVSARDVESTIRIAKDVPATPIARAAVGARVRRFLEQLEEKEIYGYEARQALAPIAALDGRLDAAARDQLERIAKYRDAVDTVPAESLNNEHAKSIMAAIDNLVACDRAPAAQRAYDRYFTTEGVPHKSRGIEYNAAQTFLTTLRKHIKAG